MGFYEERIKRIKSEMQRAELDALVLFKPQNTYYVSYFNAIIYSRPVIATLPLEGEPTLIVPRLRMGHAKEESRIKDVRVYHKIRISQAPAGIATNPMDLLKGVLKEHNVLRGKIGIEMDFLPIITFEELRKTLVCMHASFIDASNIFRKLRIVKDEEEIEMIRRAAEISDAGMEAAIEAISERKTEIEVSISAMSAMNEYWEDKYPESEVSDFGGLEGGIVNALWCYCLSGPRVSFACESPSTHKLRDGDIPVTVILTTLNAYHAENERTVVVGKMTKKQRKAFEAYLDARQKVLDAIRPGVTCSEVAKAGADALEKLGYAKYAIARAGHSMGLSMHEEPSFSLGEETILQPNMVMSVEPTIAIEGVGTFDHSDVIVVTKKGHRLLTKYRRNLITV